MASEWDIVYIAMAIEGALIFMVNSIAFTVSLKSKGEVFFNNLVFTFLFASHIFCGLLNICVGVVEYDSKRIPGNNIINDLDNNTIKNAFHMSRDLFGGLEVIFTILISMERYVAIRKPLLHGNLNAKHGLLVILFAIAIPIGFSVWRSFSASAFLVVSAVTFMGAITVTVTNIALYRSIKRHSLHISRNMVAGSSENTIIQRQKLELEHRKLKGLMICVFISTTFLVSWFPVGIKFMVKFLLRINKQRFYWDVVFSIVVFSNSFWDVFIYFYNKKSARQALLRIIMIGRRRRNVNTVLDITSVPTQTQEGLN